LQLKNVMSIFHSRNRLERNAFRLLISAHHPDTLRYPVAGPIATPSDRLRHALTWNMFKTLEQIAPSVWMRSLVARCAGLPEGYNSAPQVGMVTCWSSLELPPSARLRRGKRHPVPVSVIVDTDDTVVSLLTPAQDDLLNRVSSDSAEDVLLEVAEATAWLAGTRSAYVGVILPIEADENVWIPRVQQRAERVKRVLEASERAPVNIRGIGATTWHALHDLLSEVAASSFIADSERRYALTAVEWMGAHLRTHLHRQRLA
jgi:hypothetical protein